MLVVGGGRSGLAGGDRRRPRRGDRVVLVEAERELGGRWRVGDAEPLGARAIVAGAELLTGVDGRRAGTTGWSRRIGDEARFEIRAGAVVAATGSYDRVPLVPGADRPGVHGGPDGDRLLIERLGVVPGDARAARRRAARSSRPPVERLDSRRRDA